jgi:hypothetical protein
VRSALSRPGEDFLAHPDEKILAQLAAHPRLSRQFETFARCTLRAFDQERRCPDLLGHGNLSISRGAESGDAEQGPRLWLLDFGIFDVGSAGGAPGLTAKRSLAVVERIRALTAARSG